MPSAERTSRHEVFALAKEQVEEIRSLYDRLERYAKPGTGHEDSPRVPSTRSGLACTGVSGRRIPDLTLAGS